MPVLLYNFSHTATQSDITLHWTTHSEVNTREFVVQKSANGIDFEDLAAVPAQGAPSVPRYYTYTDASPFYYPVTNYYRLKMVDLDGSYSYSQVISKQLASNAHYLSIYDVLVKQNCIEMYISPPSNGLLHIHLLNEVGQLVAQKTVSAADLRQKVSLPVNSLSSGVYILKVFDTKDVVSRKLAITNQ
jgi:hypothetical protein